MIVLITISQKNEGVSMKKIVISLLVENTAGVLSRISGLFSRRGYNIDSLTVGAAEDSRYARMTVVAKGEDDILEQIQKQLVKLIDVVEIMELPENAAVTRELVLVRVEAKAAERQQVISIADIFRAKIVDVAEESLMIELTGSEDKIDAFLRLLEQHRVLELARTGITGLGRGMELQRKTGTSII